MFHNRLSRDDRKHTPDAVLRELRPVSSCGIVREPEDIASLNFGGNAVKRTNNRHDPRQQLSPDDRDSWRIFRIMAEFVEGFEVMAPVGRAVSIFGSARSRPGDPFYQQAEETARLLAKDDFAVITGGGPGIMEAGNK